MENLLSLTWYVESPIDFEHKQYVLWGYLQKVDISFLNKELSPHLLHMERLSDELNFFKSSFDMIRKDFEKHRYIFLEDIKLKGEDNKFIYEIRDIVDFAIPQVESRIRTGYKIFERNKQILY